MGGEREGEGGGWKGRGPHLCSSNISCKNPGLQVMSSRVSYELGTKKSRTCLRRRMQQVGDMSVTLRTRVNAVTRLRESPQHVGNKLCRVVSL